MGETLCKSLLVLSKSLIQQEVIQHHFIKKLSGNNPKIIRIPKSLNLSKSINQGEVTKDGIIKGRRKTILQNIESSKYAKEIIERSQKKALNEVSTISKPSVLKKKGINTKVKERKSASNLHAKGGINVKSKSSGHKHNISVPNRKKLKNNSSLSQYPSMMKGSFGVHSDWNNMMKELKRTISEGHSTASMIEFKRPDSTVREFSRSNFESESASVSSNLSTDDEEELLNNIIDAIDRCNNVKQTPSKNKFDLRLWRKL